MRNGSKSFALSILMALLALSVVLPLPAGARSSDAQLSAQQQRVLDQYARDTWQSFVAMTDPHTGLPADSLGVDGTRSVQTSTTNIGAYMWSTLVAENSISLEYDQKPWTLTFREGRPPRSYRLPATFPEGSHAFWSHSYH